MRNVQLGLRTIADIDGQVSKIMRGLGNPEPPINLRHVRELLRIDCSYYSSSDDSLIREVTNRLIVAGVQILQRPSLVRDAIKEFRLKALYLPDQKKILLDSDVPAIKHRWNEAHEVGHDIIPWHAGMTHGDTEQTLTPDCHAQLEAEANYAGGRILFLGDRFAREAADMRANFASIISLAERFGNTITSTLWQYVEQVRPDVPKVALVSTHPHPHRSMGAYRSRNSCYYSIRSLSFTQRFSAVDEANLLRTISGYSNDEPRGDLGRAQVALDDDLGIRHKFEFETFHNGYYALTLGVYERAG